MITRQWQALDVWGSAKGLVDVKAATSNFAVDILGATLLGRSFDASAGKFSDTYEAYRTITREMFNPIFISFLFLVRAVAVAGALRTALTAFPLSARGPHGCRKTSHGSSATAN